MVRRLTLCLALTASIGTPALAGPDWRAAGGPIFTPPAPAEATAPKADPVRVHAPPQAFEVEVGEAAARHGLDPKLLRALVAVESAFRPDAISPAGAAGLTQLMPATAEDLAVADRFDVRASLQGGAEYLARQLVRFGDVRLALAAYNAGPDRVARRGEVPPFAETRQYVDRVVDCYLALSAGRAIRSARDCRSPVR